jgi:hypothetical protein
MRMTSSVLLLLCFVMTHTPNAATEEEESVRVPRSALGIQWPAKRADADASPFKFGVTPNALSAIADLPARLKPSLEKLEKLAETIGREQPALPKDGATSVEYFSGVNVSMFGLKTNGVSHGGDPRIPPAADKWYSEFHSVSSEQGKRLESIVAHTDKGERYLINRLVYDDGGHLIASISFNQNGFSYGMYGLWEDDRLVLVCRLLPAGLVFFTCAVYADKMLAYSVEYVVKKDVSREPILRSITLSNSTTLNFDVYGRLSEMYARDPRQKLQHEP